MTSRLTAALAQLRDALAPVRLPMPLPGAADQAKSARDIVAQLDDYVLPRLETIDAPLLTVVGGSTGAGKSTLVNSIVGRRVTIPGVIRPTTRSPVLIHHPDDETWFLTDRILPGMARAHGASLDTKALQLVAEPTLPRGLALLDAPDIDSVVAENRRLAAQLLAAADLWLFVTSAARYADAVPWDYLRQAAERSAAVGVVCNRVPPSAMGDVPPHLAQMMTQRGLESSPLFAVPETTADADGLLPDAAVSPIRDWLASLAADTQTRQAVVLQTLDGAIGHLSLRAPRVSQAVRDQVATIERLQSDADTSFAEAVRTITMQTADGSLLRGEVLARWHDFVGTGELFRRLDEKVGWIRDRIGSMFAPKQNQDAETVQVAVGAGLEALIREEGEAAVERAEAAWMAHPAGREIVKAAREDLRHPSPEFAQNAARVIRDWQGDVIDLVAGAGMEKRNVARFAALGVNGLGVALMLVVFFNTGGITGAEIGVAGGSAALAQRVLEAIFGDTAVRELAQKAKSDLDARVEGLLATELERFHAALAALQVEPGQIEKIDAAVAAVENARREGLPTLPLADQTAIGSGLLTELETPDAASPVPLQQAALPPVAAPVPAPEVVDAEIVEERG